MCWSAKFHYAIRIRKLRKNEDTAKAQLLLEASEQSDIDQLAEMKRVNGSKSKGQAMPEEIDGETEPDKRLEKFKEVYENLDC
jgi:hypothetical protein